MAEHLSNRVHRAVEDRGAGLLPLLPAELGSTLAVAAALTFAVHLFVGVLAAGALAAGLMAWRRHDRGRADYAKVYLRSVRMPDGEYPPHAHDPRAVPWSKD